jgi:hypothetical protein
LGLGSVGAGANEQIKRRQDLTLPIPDRFPSPEINRHPEALSWLQTAVEASKPAAGVQDLRRFKLSMPLLVVELEHDESGGRPDAGTNRYGDLAPVGKLYKVARGRFRLVQSHLQSLFPDGPGSSCGTAAGAKSEPEHGG